MWIRPLPGVKLGAVPDINIYVPTVQIMGEIVLGKSAYPVDSALWHFQLVALVQTDNILDWHSDLFS